METLYLQNDSQSITLHLHGAGAVSPWTGARRQPETTLDGERVEEIFDLALEGAGISGCLNDLERLLGLASNGLEKVYLFLSLELQTTPYRARVLAGRVELLGTAREGRARRVQGVRLRLVRTDFWEGSLQSIPLTNPNGSAVQTGLGVFNHTDAGSGHANWVDIQAQDVPGSLPVPALVQICHTLSAGCRLQTIYLGLGTRLSDADGALEHALEAEFALPGPNVSAVGLPDANASNANFLKLTWSSVNEERLAAWTISTASLDYLSGRCFRPAIRLHASPPQGLSLRARLRRDSTGELLSESEAVALETGQRLAVLPGLYLPPWNFGGGPYAPLTLEVWGECAAAGSKELQLDFLHVLPAEHWLTCHPLGGLAENRLLSIDSAAGVCWSEDLQAANQEVSHALSGSGVWLQPGVNQRLYLLFEDDAGSLPDRQVQVRVYARPRKRVL